MKIDAFFALLAAVTLLTVLYLGSAEAQGECRPYGPFIEYGMNENGFYNKNGRIDDDRF
ncbi:MAG: hypothetical protein ACYS8I_16895 [Planctomycetota bacterium]|jgi:hypothetical protein